MRRLLAAILLLFAVSLRSQYTITAAMSPTVEFLNLQGQQSIIDVSDLSPGIYFLKIQSGNNTSIKKVIIN